MNCKDRNLTVFFGLALAILIGVLLWSGREKIRFLFEFESIGKNVQGYPEYRHRETDIVFVSLPGGSFDMGSPEDEEGRWEREGPVHRVTLSPFFIAKTEVTRAQWVIPAVLAFQRQRLGSQVEALRIASSPHFVVRVKVYHSLPSRRDWRVFASRPGS